MSCKRPCTRLREENGELNKQNEQCELSHQGTRQVLWEQIGVYERLLRERNEEIRNLQEKNDELNYWFEKHSNIQGFI